MTPIPFEWSGDAMIPAPGFRKRCDEQYVVGERYTLEVIEDRSSATHRHLFAAIRECWMNLPEKLALQYPTPDHLRKHALIVAGFCDSRTHICKSRAAALEVARFVQPIDSYAMVVARGCTVTVFTAKSQAMRAMPRAEFQASKTAILDFCASLIGTTPGELAKAGEAA